MRKRIANSDAMDHLMTPSFDHWLDLQEMASVEVTSEDPNFPIEAALISGDGGWRAAEKDRKSFAYSLISRECCIV
jgi:type IV secretory pathway VirJ component